MAEQEQRAEGKKKSLKMLIIIVIVLVTFVIGGGVAAYFLMGGLTGSVENTEEAQEQTEPEPKRAETLYYDISKPLIVDFPRGSQIHLIQVSLSILVEGEATLEALKKHDPMIRNNLLMLISSQDADSLNSREGKDKLRADILEEVGSILEKMTGTNDVKQVFFTAFVMQ
ncbi:MAG: flagellar basal body-associated FliL family protein [Gammaproteobacteria bacterium]